MKRELLIKLVVCLLSISLACTISFNKPESEELSSAQLMQTVDALQESSNDDASCNRIALVVDVNLPDGTDIDSGEKFSKQWELINGGTCTWTAAYQIAEVSAKDNSVIRYYDFNGFAEPGEKTYAKVDLQAPQSTGNYIHYFMLVDEAGRKFGWGENAKNPFWVDYQVSSSKAASAPDTEEENATKDETFENEPEETPCLLLGKVRDISMPDGTQMEPGEQKNKTWELTNTGTCPWDAEFEIVDAGGDFMKTVKDQAIGKSVQPGGMVQVTVPVVAPPDAGVYFNYWKMRSTSGQTFGGGENADAAFWVKIEVVAEEEPEPLPPDEPSMKDITVDWGMGGLTHIGLGKCPTAAFDPEVTLSVISDKDMTIAYDFILEGNQTYPEPQVPVYCSSPENNNRWLKDLKAGQTVTIKGVFTNCDVRNYFEGSITIRVYEKKTFSSVKLGESSISYTHTCGK